MPCSVLHGRQRRPAATSAITASGRRAVIWGVDGASQARMAYWMVVRSVYSCIVTIGANIRICARCDGAAGFLVRRECGACGYGLGLACLVLGNRLAGRSGQDGLQICCGGFDRPVDARLAGRVEKAAVADVTDRPALPRLVGQVLQDLAGSGPWSGISVPSTPGTTFMMRVGAGTARDRAGLRSPGAVPGPRRPG
jgi:hypothetical protein